MGREQLTTRVFVRRAAGMLAVGGRGVPRFHASGVTLAEVVVAAGLLLIALVPMLKALTIAHITERTIARKTHSLMLAQRELERIKAKSIHHYNDDFTQTSRVLEGAFRCTVTDDTGANLKRVTVSVGLDQNQDNVLSPGETDVCLCTCLARRWPLARSVGPSEQPGRAGLQGF